MKNNFIRNLNKNLNMANPNFYFIFSYFEVKYT